MTKTMFKALRATAFLALLAVVPAAAHAAEEGGDHPSIARQSWTFGGFFGFYDNAQLQRGFQVYQQVCAACHGLDRVYFRNLAEPGGPEFPEAGVKALAASWPNQIPDGPEDKGAMFERPAKLSDPIRGPYKNANEARASQNGALPPDLSLITKARGIEPNAPWYAHIVLMARDILRGYQEAGADYVYALMVGYEQAPANVKVAAGMHYNKAFAGHQIAMPPPLEKDNFVKYQDGSGSLEANARDLAAFLSWAADPSLEARKRIGWQVMLYLLITTVLMYLAKRRIWASAH